MARLYPNLNEPWSDVDDEGMNADEDTLGSDHYYNERDEDYHGRPDHQPRETLHYHNASSENGGGGRTDSVNLAEFEDYYAQHRPSPGYGSERRKDRLNLSPGNASSRRVGGESATDEGPRRIEKGRERGREVVGGIAQWVVNASWWQKALLGSLLGLLCAILFGALQLQMEKTSKDNFLPCPADSHDRPCISEIELLPAKLLAGRIANILHDRAAKYICGGIDDVLSLNISVQDLKLLLPKTPPTSRREMETVFYLFTYNPHWNVRWMNYKGDIVGDWTHTIGDSDLLASISPSISFKCGVWLQIANLWRYTRGVIIVALCILVVAGLVFQYFKRRKTESSAVYGLVGRIMDVMKYHYKKTQNKKVILPYLAIIHVRDMLIPPSERKEKERVWGEAVAWISNNESRVRVETRRIAGEDFEVWRWIQDDPPPTEEPVSQPVVSSCSKKSASNAASAGNQGNWHGNVFDHYPPEITTKVAPPAGTPSLCIRLKNMFEPVKKMEESQTRELENAVLERCRFHGAVVHIWIDKKSPFGCVYLKMDSLKSAMGAYNALHGGWYKGKLVTAKYIPESKYHKWFPLTVNAKKLLLPS